MTTPLRQLGLREMLEGDLPGADRLCQLAGWNQTLPDWQRFLALAPGGCFVAEHKTEVVGTVTTICYGPALAWLGMMLVHPEYRRQGIGIGLMRRALDSLQRVRCIRLDATPAGRPLYEKLGFAAEWTLTRWLRPERRDDEAPSRVATDTRSLESRDWESVHEIDRLDFGVSRTRLLRSLAASALATRVWPAQGPLRGFGFLRPGATSHYLGPLAGPRMRDPHALVEALLHVAGGRSVVWDIPDANEIARAIAERFGFAPLRPLTRMRLGSGSSVTDPMTHFAIADPAVG